MASTTPNKPDEPTLSAEALKELNVQETLAFKRRNPESVRVALSAQEQRTIDHLRDQDKGFWKRVGKYEKILKQEASDEVPALLQRMQKVNESTTERLKFFGLKNAERFAAITARINVAGRTLDAIRKQREIFAQTSKDLTEGNAAFRAQVMADHPITSRIPLVRHILVPQETPLKETHDLDYTKLEQAARNVQSTAKSEKSQWEAKITQRLKGVRGVENKLREVVLRYDKDAIDDIETELRACAGKKCERLRSRVQGLKIEGLDERSLKVLQDNLSMWMHMLEGRSGGMSKAFEMAGRTELMGTAVEMLTQISSLPMGTRLQVMIPGFAPETREVVIDAKRPANCILFKTIGSNQRIAVDMKQRAVWGYEAEISPALQRINAFMGEIKPALVAEKITDASLIAKVQKALMDDVGDDPVELAGSRLLGVAEKALTEGGVEAAKAKNVRTALEGKLKALPSFPALWGEIKDSLAAQGVRSAFLLTRIEQTVKTNLEGNLTGINKNSLITAIQGAINPPVSNPKKLGQIKAELEKISAFDNLSAVVRHREAKPFARQIEFDQMRFKYPND